MRKEEVRDNSLEVREAFQKKKIAQKGTFAHLGGRGVKKIPIEYHFRNGTNFHRGRGLILYVLYPISKQKAP